MKSIKFIDPSFKNPLKLVLTIIALSLCPLVLLDVLDIFSFENSIINKYINITFYLLLTVNLLQIFFYKNAVLCYKNQINLRINKFFYDSVVFSDIARINFTENEYVITKIGGKRIEINLTDIVESDKEKLKMLLKLHIDAV